MTVGKSNFSEPVSMEVLKYLFSSTDNEHDQKLGELLASASDLEELLAKNPVIDDQRVDQKVDEKKQKQQKTESPAETEISTGADDEPELAQAEAKEISGETSTGSVKIDHIITSSDERAISKDELVKILEAAVTVIMDSSKVAHANLPQVIPSETAHSIALQAQALIQEKDSEINELKTLLVEAQSTIIKLLTDRVDDRSKLATLESQAKFLPDFQRTNAQAMGVAMSAANNDMLLRDIGKVKAEVERLKGSRGQAFATGEINPSLWTKIRRWLTH
jgi:hypothetical protein